MSKQPKDDPILPAGTLVTQLILSIICLVHLTTIFCYAILVPVSAFLFPLACLVAISGHFMFSRNRRVLMIAACGTLLVIIFAIAFSAFFFDFSWDGQWYQQATVYELGKGWDALHSPLVTPGKVDQSSILHFPKSAWYFGAALLRLFGNVEVGKAYNVLLLFAAFGVVYGFCRSHSLAVWKSVCFSILILLNPVVWSEITTYLNDGDLYLLLVIYLSSVIMWISKRKYNHLLIACLSVCCLVNTKFTGLVFFMITAFVICIYILFTQRKFALRFVLTHAAIGLLAVGVFGFNPYVTNTIYRGHPLYPLMGTKAYPSVFAGGGDDNEAYETPQNIKGKSLPVRLFYTSFGKPGNAPYNGENGAKLVNPFNIDYKTWTAYHYHETRVSGFGPYFGILLVLSLIGLPILLYNDKKQLRVSLFWVLGLIVCLSLSRHFWWPRFFPLLWLFPFLPLWLTWRDSGISKTLKYRDWYGWLLAVFLIINGLIVAVVHMGWEMRSSIALRMELGLIQNKHKTIMVDYGWFKQSMEEKLNHYQIPFIAGGLSGPDSLKRPLPSVVEGYPNQVVYQFK